MLYKERAFTLFFFFAELEKEHSLGITIAFTVRVEFFIRNISSNGYGTVLIELLMYMLNGLIRIWHGGLLIIVQVPILLSLIVRRNVMVPCSFFNEVYSLSKNSEEKQMKCFNFLKNK